MTGTTVSPPEPTPSVPPSYTPQQCIALWADLMDACEQFVLAGLRREIGPDGDLNAAYRKWYAEQMEEHRRTTLHIMERFNQAVENMRQSGTSDENLICQARQA